MNGRSPTPLLTLHPEDCSVGPLDPGHRASFWRAARGPTHDPPYLAHRRRAVMRVSRRWCQLRRARATSVVTWGPSLAEWVNAAVAVGIGRVQGALDASTATAPLVTWPPAALDALVRAPLTTDPTPLWRLLDTERSRWGAVVAASPLAAKQLAARTAVPREWTEVDRALLAMAEGRAVTVLGAALASTGLSDLVLWARLGVLARSHPPLLVVAGDRLEPTPAGWEVVAGGGPARRVASVDRGFDETFVFPAGRATAAASTG